MADLQTLLSYFLQGLVGGQTLVGSGSVSLPAYAFLGDPDTGMANLSTNQVDLIANGTSQAQITTVGVRVPSGNLFYWLNRSQMLSTADGVWQVTNANGTGFTRAIFGTNDATTNGASFAMVGGQLVRRAGDGTTAAGQATVGPVTNGGTASIATFTVGASDGIFQVSADVSVTTSSNHTFSIDCVYTDAASNSRTMLLPMEQLLTGNFISGALITNTLGVGAYASATMQIRAKAATTITLRTSAGGTFTGVVYTTSASIVQIG